jgi:hypothetical protein
VEICTQEEWQHFWTEMENFSEESYVSEIISIDYFSVPAINFKILHVLVFISHERRKIIHFNVTSNPTSEWAV